MTTYVLILSLGPVQGFIAAARRSRDLWSGSWLLSEISKAAAKALQDGGAELIFPAPDSDLRPDSELSVGNKVQAVFSATDDQPVRELADAAKRSARQRFRQIAEGARQDIKDDSALRGDIWQAQVDDYVEAYAAWARIGDAGYGAAADAAAGALAARKATRNFHPSARSAEEAPYFGLPKSSLDGARETVLREGRYGLKLRRRLGLSESEQLDCAGIAKRLGGDIDQFTPYTRITAHAWINALPQGDRQALALAYEPLVKPDLTLATRVAGNGACYQNFPYDAQLLYRSRLEAALRDAVKETDSAATQALQDLRELLKPLWRRYSEPCTYGVILLADGDRMGALLSEVKEQNHHIRITGALSAFAGSVRLRVREFSGHAIYAGGDDVLAFLPLDRAFECAKVLQQDFADCLQPLAHELNATNLPTLSVGLAIGHIMEPLGNLRTLASLAEKKAKGDDRPDALKRNALGIALRVRSGGLTTLRLRWDDHSGLADFAHWQACYLPENRQLPSRLAYDARQVHQRTAFALEGENKERGIQDAEFVRLLDRARTESGEKLTEKLKARLTVRSVQTGLATLADELIVARWLAARSARDLGDDR
ncbi:type III-B CRISPR-associated protein Cas10/Cmr2 [Propionivibrio sp.]|uniref:type III-B CRISPR-associated protein Cas10/Cmr2 n=1 Tax=Propionivibrio sp. TaxID=2212460 RepID=UPI003BEF76A5